MVGQRWKIPLYKMDELGGTPFFRKPPYAYHVAQVVPDIAALPFANVSVMTWVVGRAGQRQVVSSGDRSCVPIDEWLAGSFIWVLSNIVFRIPHKSSMINHHILGHSTLCQIDEPIISDQQVVFFFFCFFHMKRGYLQ